MQVGMPPSAQIHHASTTREEAQAAVRELADALGPAPKVVFAFVSSSYDLDELGPALQSAFRDACVVACTTAGQIGSNGFQPTGISAVGLSGPFEAESFVIDSLTEMADSVKAASNAIRKRVESLPEGHSAFGFLLVDGLSMLEERLAAALYMHVGDLSIIGGSAGDNLKFEATHVLAGGTFRTNAAVLTVVSTPLPFRTMKVMHHEPSDQRLVITAADPERRIVNQINGKPAAQAYAELVGLPVDALGPEAFSKHPVVLRVDDRCYIRSIQKILDDESIVFYCAIERGMVLSLARPARVMESLTAEFGRVEREIGKPSVILGCDCILRLLELEEMGLDDEVGRFFSAANVVGFSTYGEQVDGIHVNQTFTGIAIGAA